MSIAWRRKIFPATQHVGISDKDIVYSATGSAKPGALQKRTVIRDIQIMMNPGLAAAGQFNFLLRAKIRAFAQRWASARSGGEQ